MTRKTTMGNPYCKSDSPKMLPSFVCFADILGYSQLSNEAVASGNGDEFLHRLRRALSSAYARVRQHSKAFMDDGEDSFFAIKVFTDNIVVGYPLDRPDFNHGEPELGDILGTFSEFQTALAVEGFFLRGGIAFGELYMDDDIVFGDALIQAVSQDKAGGAPRIALTQSAVEKVRQQLRFYGDDTSFAPHHDCLLLDADGKMFLNYLSEAFFAFPDAPPFFEIIEAHQRNIVEALNEYRGNPGVRSKYEWAARYHNFVCRDFAEKHPVPADPGFDEMYALAALEAQKLSDYLIDMEALAASPRHISTSIEDTFL